MNIKNELAFQIFLKKMPAERFNDMTLRAYTGAAEDSLKIAQVFIDASIANVYPKENLDHLILLDKGSL